MPKAFDTPKVDAEAAIEPRTAFGKWWQKVRDAVERAKEQFERWLNDYGEELALATISSAQLATILTISDMSELGDGFTVAMVMGPLIKSRKIGGRAKTALNGWTHPGGTMISDEKKPFKALRKWEENYIVKNGKLVLDVVESGVARRYTSENYSKMNAFERLSRNCSEFKKLFPNASNIAEYERINGDLSSQIKKAHIERPITVARGLKTDIYQKLAIQ